MFAGSGKRKLKNQNHQYLKSSFQVFSNSEVDIIHYILTGTYLID